MKVLVTVLVALALHLVLGWPWTVLAGVLAGVWAVRRGWLVGALGVGGGWLIVVLYNFVVAGRATRTMVDTVGEMLGNLPGVVVVGMTLLIGAALGAIGGLIGTQAALFVRSSRSSEMGQGGGAS